MAFFFQFLLLSFILLISPLKCLCQHFKVLHYTETSGYDHRTRAGSFAMFQEIGAGSDFNVDNDQTGEPFNTLTGLKQYKVVIFSNTSGNAILDSAQKANFEAYIQDGGAFIGIHAASDTYRHSGANGTNTGTWDWYAEMLGASVQQIPNHTASDFEGTLDTIGEHPAITNLPDPWIKTDEYYYWEKGYFNTDNIPVLQVRSTGPESYDSARPISWYKSLPNGGRVFYTALGHSNEDFTSDTIFRTHIRDAIRWAAGKSSTVNSINNEDQMVIYPNPVNNRLFIKLPANMPVPGAIYRVLDTQGNTILKGEWTENLNEKNLDVNGLFPGKYIFEIKGKIPRSYLSEKLIIK